MNEKRLGQRSKGAFAFYLLLAATIGLTIEEGAHLAHHYQGWPPDNLKGVYHPGCTVRAEDSRVMQCPVDGFNYATFYCSDIACRFKDPSGGFRVTSAEKVILDTYMTKRTKAEADAFAAREQQER